MGMGIGICIVGVGIGVSSSSPFCLFSCFPGFSLLLFIFTSQCFGLEFMPIAFYGLEPVGRKSTMSIIKNVFLFFF